MFKCKFVHNRAALIHLFPSRIVYDKPEGKKEAEPQPKVQPVQPVDVNQYKQRGDKLAESGNAALSQFEQKLQTPEGYRESLQRKVDHVLERTVTTFKSNSQTSLLEGFPVSSRNAILKSIRQLQNVGPKLTSLLSSVIGKEIPQYQWKDLCENGKPFERIFSVYGAYPDGKPENFKLTVTPAGEITVTEIRVDLVGNPAENQPPQQKVDDILKRTVTTFKSYSQTSLLEGFPESSRNAILTSIRHLQNVGPILTSLLSSVIGKTIREDQLKGLCIGGKPFVRLFSILGAYPNGKPENFKLTITPAGNIAVTYADETPVFTEDSQTVTFKTDANNSGNQVSIPKQKLVSQNPEEYKRSLRNLIDAAASEVDTHYKVKNVESYKEAIARRIPQNQLKDIAPYDKSFKSDGKTFIVSISKDGLLNVVQQ